MPPITKDNIHQYIEAIPTATDDQLVWLYKVAISKDSPSDKKLFAPLANASQVERRKRKTITTISSKIVNPTAKPKSSPTADDYDDE